MSFVLGGAVPATPAALRQPGTAPAALTEGTEYLVSPRRARITFTSVEFRAPIGQIIGTSPFTACTVTYDGALASASTLLNCPFEVPVGDIQRVDVTYDRTLQLLVSDPQVGIYSDPSSATGYTTSAPAGGAGFVPLQLAGADANGRVHAQITFPSAITIAAGSTPTLYITTDMIQTLQIRVNPGGTTLSPSSGGNNGSVVLFGGLTRGSSHYYSNAPSTGTYRIGSVNQFHEFRIFYDQAGNPLYLTSPTCVASGSESAQRGGAWASPPGPGGMGGWLGRDANRVLAWASTTGGSSTSYIAYFVMPEQTVIGQTTVMRCMKTASPPPPADGKTYASGAPAMPTPYSTSTMTLQAK